jgi:hypothetical protein
LSASHNCISDIIAGRIWIIARWDIQHGEELTYDYGFELEGYAKRRGPGWLPGLATIGWSNRLGWYEGLHLRLAVSPVGVITGVGFGSASTQDQRLAETFFARRRCPHPQWCGAGARG